MTRTGFHALPPEIQRKVFSEFSSDDVLHFLCAHQLSPQSLHGVFQLITNHNHPSALCEVSIPRIHIDDYSPSVSRALINVIELTDFLNVDQKTLYQKLSHKTNFIYVVREHLFSPKSSGADRSHSIDESTRVLGLPVTTEHDPQLIRSPGKDRLKDFFQHFLPFCKILFQGYKMKIDMKDHPDLTDLTITSSEEVNIVNATSLLPKLRDIETLITDDPSEELFQDPEIQLTSGVLKEFRSGSIREFWGTYSSSDAPGFEMECHDLEVEKTICLNRFHTVRDSTFTCESLEFGLCNFSTEDAPLLEDVSLIDVGTVEFRFDSHPPILSDFSFGSTVSVAIKAEDMNYCQDLFADDILSFVKLIVNELPELESLELAGNQQVSSIFTGLLDEVGSTSVQSLSVSCNDDRLDGWGEGEVCRGFPNLTTLLVRICSINGFGRLDWLPYIDAPKVETLTIELYSFEDFYEDVLRSFIESYPTTRDLSLQCPDLLTLSDDQVMSMTQFRETLSPISTKLEKLDLDMPYVGFLTDVDEHIELPELKRLVIESGGSQLLPLDTWPCRFELSILAPKLESLECGIFPCEELIIKNFPLLKTIEVSSANKVTVLENLPELKSFSSMKGFGEVIYCEIIGCGLPLLEVVRLPYMEVKLKFDETVNPGIQLIPGTHN